MIAETYKYGSTRRFKRKQCTRCLRFKKPTEFRILTRWKTPSLSSQCKRCDYMRTKEWVQKNRGRYNLQMKRAWAKRSALGKNHENHIKKTYGLTRERYLEILSTQGGVCAICKSANPVTHQKYLCVDHDHETGKIRGLLCFHCNVALGYAEKMGFDKIARYLGW